jgi:hypothetical protein
VERVNAPEDNPVFLYRILSFSFVFFSGIPVGKSLKISSFLIVFGIIGLDDKAGSPVVGFLPALFLSRRFFRDFPASARLSSRCLPPFLTSEKPRGELSEAYLTLTGKCVKLNCRCH